MCLSAYLIGRERQAETCIYPVLCGLQNIFPSFNHSSFSFPEYNGHSNGQHLIELQGDGRPQDTEDGSRVVGERKLLIPLPRSELHSPEKGSARVPTLTLQMSGSAMENASFKVTQA